MAQIPDNHDRNTIVVKIEDEMRGAYLDYAMSVIVGRALPDVRDGLKPVHRRVLYAKYDRGNFYNKAYKKSARVVGDVIGKSPPHGDTAVYDTIVRLAQSFSMRYPLVDGQGNFGSIDGDSAAAMRYTEVRMAKVADEIMSDLDKETVDFGANYDDSLTEPRVMPSRIPNLLVNGSSGIAVGMATSIPPHNMTEIVDAAVALIDDPSIDTDGVLKFVKGPDFPTAGFAFGGQALRHAYRTGRGNVTMRGKAEIEAFKGDRERIIITELPYQVNKAKLIEKVADLVKEKRVEGISDLRDESDRTGMRIVIEIKKNENANVILNQLYKLTQLQDSYGIMLLAIHNGQPRIFNLRDMIWAFIEHRKDVVTRRTIYNLKKAEARAHILEGLKRAVENIDEVITLIKAAKGPDEARASLMGRFEFSDLQAQAILDLRLQRLTGLEREKIIEEYRLILKLIEELKTILGSEKLVYEVVRKELLEVREEYGDERRTTITIDEATDFEVEDLISDEDTLVSITHTGYIKRSDPREFKSQNRGGKGIRAVTTGEEDFVSSIFGTNTLANLLVFTDRGKVYRLKVYKIPEASRVAKGKAIVNLVGIQAGEKVRAILPIQDFKETEFVVTVTRSGVIKKTALSEYAHIRTLGITAVLIDEGDELVSVKLTYGKNDIFLCSKEGMSIRFPETDVRSMGRSSHGVTGMSLAEGDRVVAMEVLEPSDEAHAYEILTITDQGYGKRTPVKEYRAQTRGGKGIITMKVAERNGCVMGARQVLPKDDLMLVSDKGQMIRIQVEGISEQGRNTTGVRLMNVAQGEKVVAVEYLATEPPETQSIGEGNGPAADGSDTAH